MARRLRSPEGQLGLFESPRPFTRADAERAVDHLRRENPAPDIFDIRGNPGFGPDTSALERNAAGQPLSPETGGPLSAAEVDRLVAGRGLRVIGYRFQDGSFLCRACASAECPRGGYPPSMSGHGFMTSAYSDDRGVREECCRCGGPVRSDL